MPRKREHTIPWVERREPQKDGSPGSFYVWWHTAKGRIERQSLGTTDPVEAQARFAAFLTGGSDAFRGAKEAPSLTVSGALDDYMREHVAQKVVDKKRQQHAVDHLKAFFGNRPLGEIDIPASRSFADARRAGLVASSARWRTTPITDACIRRELGVLRAAAEHALRWRRIAPAEMPRIELTPGAAPRQDHYLTKVEVQRIITAASGMLRAFIELAYYTAARKGSVQRLSRAQVDLQAGRINLTSEAETTLERASKKRRPVVPIDAKLRPTLERLMMAESDSPWLLGGVCREPIDRYNQFQDHMLKLGFPRAKAHPHILRHSRATHLLQDGVSIYDVARLLGDTVGTVEKVYGHHSADYLADAIARAR